MDPYNTSAAETAILAVLAGAPIADAAAQVRWSPGRLAEAVELYRAAGRAALDAQPDPTGWHQVYIEFADYPTAEHAFATHVLPPLRTATDTGTVAAWWFLRKQPCWRLRVTPGPNATVEGVGHYLAEPLDRTVTMGLTKRWWPSLYEPETAAFGGPDGMTIAHDLFHTDSVGVLDYLHDVKTDSGGLLDAKATSFLVISAFLRAARQEWSEQGDVWARVEAKRPLPDGVPVERLTTMTHKLQKLLAIDPSPALAAGGSLAPLAKWINAVRTSGRALTDAGQEGQLTLGTRTILARHILFHWNRMGFTTRQQAMWARAARETMLGH
ncbi:thiopeptide-type bacteriocin biosynthesis protein [Streptomyces sp. NPDC097640]|uniref:thiopeptide-type bacteriocin biosynthesis protein n=1 Tax=Streptomyces sp. NPDC097640 TaxID=3157229 RepID=UPI0033206A2A